MEKLKKKKKKVILVRDELGRIPTKKKNPKPPGQRKKPIPYTLSFSDKDNKLMESNPLFKEINNIGLFIEKFPLEAAEQLINKDLAILTALTDAILNNALKEGEIFQGNKVNPLLKQQNYLAFQSAKRQTANTLLKIMKMREEREEKAAAKRKKPKPVSDLDILLSVD